MYDLQEDDTSYSYWDYDPSELEDEGYTMTNSMAGSDGGPGNSDCAIWEDENGNQIWNCYRWGNKGDSGDPEGGGGMGNTGTGNTGQSNPYTPNYNQVYTPYAPPSFVPSYNPAATSPGMPAQTGFYNPVTNAVTNIANPVVNRAPVLQPWNPDTYEPPTLPGIMPDNTQSSGPSGGVSGGASGGASGAGGCSCPPSGGASGGSSGSGGAGGGASGGGDNGGAGGGGNDPVDSGKVTDSSAATDGSAATDKSAAQSAAADSSSSTYNSAAVSTVCDDTDDDEHIDGDIPETGPEGTVTIQSIHDEVLENHRVQAAIQRGATVVIQRDMTVGGKPISQTTMLAYGGPGSEVFVVKVTGNVRSDGSLISDEPVEFIFPPYSDAERAQNGTGPSGGPSGGTSGSPSGDPNSGGCTCHPSGGASGGSSGTPVDKVVSPKMPKAVPKHNPVTKKVAVPDFKWDGSQRDTPTEHIKKDCENGKTTYLGGLDLDDTPTSAPPPAVVHADAEVYKGAPLTTQASDKTKYTVPVMQAAEMANDVYPDGNGHISGGWRRVNYKIDKVVYSDESGFDSALYQRVNKKGEIEFAYVTRGTEMTSGKDWEADYDQAIYGTSAQYDRSVYNAQRIAEFILKNYSECTNLTFIGHSLGGGLASANALETGYPAITFNASWLSEKTIKRLAKKKADIQAFDIDGQVVEVIQNKLGLKRNGILHRLPAKYLPSPKGTPVPILPSDFLHYLAMLPSWAQRVFNHKMGVVIDKLHDQGYK